MVRENMDMMDVVWSILESDFNDRDTNDIEILQSYFRKFKLYDLLKIQKDHIVARQNSFKSMKLLRVQKGDTVFNYGD